MNSLKMLQEDYKRDRALQSLRRCMLISYAHAAGAAATHDSKSKGL